MTERTRTHRVAGDMDEVAAVMRSARESGRLMQIRSARVVSRGRVVVYADMREPVPDGEDNPWLIGLGAVIGLAALGGLVWLLVLAVMAIVSFVGAVVAWVAAHLAAILAVAGGLLLLMLYLGSEHSCSGMHCQGCRR